MEQQTWSCKHCGCLDRYRRRDGVWGACKECHRKKTLARRLSNPEKRKKQAADHYQRNKVRLKGYQADRRRKFPEKVKAIQRNAALKGAYGISSADYERMLANQGGRCAICGSSETGSKSSNHFHIDHCHTTNRVRALLCFPCNGGLGNFRDSVTLLTRAVDYLKSHEAVDREQSMANIENTERK